MTTPHWNRTTSAINAAMIAAVLVAATSLLPQPAFAKNFAQIGEDMGKCTQKFTGTQSFKDKMCACKDSACAQLTGSYQLVWTRPTAPSDNTAESAQHVN
jgi:hypothetical protein